MLNPIPSSRGPLAPSASPELISRASSAPTDMRLPELPPRAITNWNGRVTISNRAYQPTSEREIVAIVKKEPSVRVGGGMHSFNSAMAPDARGAFIDMTRFNHVFEPIKHPDGSWSVVVQPGATVRDVSVALAKQGLALENLPTSEDITIGGAVANGVHGSGLTSPAVLAEQIVGMRVVQSDGSVKKVAPEELPLYRISMGLLGIATSIELRCVPDFDLVQTDDKVTGEDAIAAMLEPSRLRADVSKYQSVMYLINEDNSDPSKTQLIRWGLTKVTDENRSKFAGLPRKETYDKPGPLQQKTIRAAYAAAAHAGPLENWADTAMRNKAQPHEPRIGKSALMYQIWLDIPAHDVSYAVPLEKAQEAFKAYCAKMRELGYQTPVTTSMRFLSASDATLMGINSGRDCVTFELCTSVYTDLPSGEHRPDVEAAEKAFEQIMIGLGGRPHWGKEYTVNPRERFPAESWNRFTAESAKVGAKFVNTWAAQMTPAAQTR